MSQNSAIEWTQDTWNPLAGCSEISPGCVNCYAALMAHRLGAMGLTKYQGTTKKLPNGKTVWTGKMNLDPGALMIPLKRKKPTTYFVNSMSDLFHEDVPDEFIDQVFAVMALSPRHTFQVLTKRAERMMGYLSEIEENDRDLQRWADAGASIFDRRGDSETGSESFRKVIENGCHYGLKNVWLGVSIENKQHGWPRVYYLRNTPAAVRFFSVEPLLEDVAPLRLDGIDWVIVGGESGPGARPIHPQWVRNIRDQCVKAGVPFFFKQWGEFVPLGKASGFDPDDNYPGRDKRVSLHSGIPMDEPTSMFRVGKKSAGRLLDGREWNEMPVQKAQVPA